MMVRSSAGRDRTCGKVVTTLSIALEVGLGEVRGRGEYDDGWLFKVWSVVLEEVQKENDIEFELRYIVRGHIFTPSQSHSPYSATSRHSSTLSLYAVPSKTILVLASSALDPADAENIARRSRAVPI